MTVAADLIGYLSGLELAGGDHDGQPLEVLGWEKRFVRGAFRRHGAAALTVGRGNGKSALVAGIAAAVADPAGPLHGRRRECVCVASSFNQARIVFEDVLSFLRTRHDIGARRLWRLQDSPNNAMIEFRPNGARVRCVGSDPKKAHGLRPFLALADEPAQWDSAKSERMVAALRTSLGKTPNSKMISLGTRPANSSHWFAKQLAGEGVAYAQVHAAGPRDPTFHARTWRRANPSFDHLPSLAAEIREEAALARADPAMLAAFKALRLNGGVSDVREAELLAAGTWAAIEGDAPADGGCVWGIDLSLSDAMSAVAAYFPATGRLEAVAAMASIPDLAERGLADGVGRLYTECAARGELIQAGENAVEIKPLLQEALRRFGAPTAIAGDRHREPEMKDRLKEARIPLAAWEKRGQGFIDGAADVEAFRRAVAEGRVTPAPSLLLTAAMGEARVIADDPGLNWKLAKGTQGGRRRRAKDDAAAAAILAVALGTRRRKTSPGGVYLGRVAAS